MAEAGYGSPTDVLLKLGNGSPVGVSCDRDAGNGGEQTASKNSSECEQEAHTDEKPYLCDDCGYRTTYSNI